MKKILLLLSAVFVLLGAGCKTAVYNVKAVDGYSPKSAALVAGSEKNLSVIGLQVWKRGTRGDILVVGCAFLPEVVPTRISNVTKEGIDVDALNPRYEGINTVRVHYDKVASSSEPMIPGPIYLCDKLE